MLDPEGIEAAVLVRLQKVYHVHHVALDFRVARLVRAHAADHGAVAVRLELRKGRSGRFQQDIRAHSLD